MKPRSPSSKIKARGSLKALLARARRSGKRVVFTNGCFDLIHPGHVSYLARARALGDLLVVALNADASVRKLKGPTRPVNSLKDRLIVMAALECVDYVTSFSEETPLQIIRELKPQVLVKGGDWKAKDIVGSEDVLASGGRVRSLPFLKGKSTTGILARI